MFDSYLRNFFQYKKDMDDQNKRDQNKKVIHCIFSPTVRGVVAQANELNIQKEDIVGTFVHQGQVYMIYYK